MNWKCQHSSGDGVITGCDKAFEWMLPWWWLHYSLHNSYPVIFLDFGMTTQGRKWCKRHGTVIKINAPAVAGKSQVAPSLIKRWDQIVKGNIWPFRKIWFQKPLGLLHTLYARSIWIDVDCEIRACLKALFPLCENRAGLAVLEEPKEYQEYLARIGAQLTDEKNCSSGVVVFRHGSPLIDLWAQKAETENHLFLGDQDALSRALFEEKQRYYLLSPSMHWRLWVCGRLEEPKEEVMICHYAGSEGKKEILKQMQEIHNSTFISLKLNG